MTTDDNIHNGIAYLLVGPCCSSVLLLTSWWVHVLHLFCCLPLGGFMFFICFVAYLLVHVFSFCVVFIFSLYLVVVCFLFCFLLCFFFNLCVWFCPFFVAPSVFTNVYLREYNQNLKIWQTLFGDKLAKFTHLMNSKTMLVFFSSFFFLAVLI